MAELLITSPSQAICKQLVEAALQWFDRADTGSIELRVLANAVARRCWEDMGCQAELLQMRAIRG
jgi:hypothetical protein